jgi:hypothetical protein
LLTSFYSIISRRTDNSISEIYRIPVYMEQTYWQLDFWTVNKIFVCYFMARFAFWLRVRLKPKGKTRHEITNKDLIYSSKVQLSVCLFHINRYSIYFGNWVVGSSWYDTIKRCQQFHQYQRKDITTYYIPNRSIKKDHNIWRWSLPKYIEYLFIWNKHTDSWTFEL